MNEFSDKLQPHAGLGANKCQTINEMSKDELIVEIAKGRASIMPKYIPFMKQRLTLIEDNEAQRDQGRAEEREDKKHDDSMKVARNANYIAFGAMFISLIALVITLLKN